MPHSPYRETIYEPIKNLGEYRGELNQHRVSYENGDDNDERESALLEIGDLLMEQCGFLDTKLNIKVHIYLLPGHFAILHGWDRS